MSVEDGDGWVPPDATLTGGCAGCALRVVAAVCVSVWAVWLALR